MMGSWLSSAVHSVANWAVGKGNAPGTPTTRKLGYDPQAVSTAVVSQLQSAPNVSGTNPQGEIVLAGAALVGLILLFRHKKAG